MPATPSGDMKAFLLYACSATGEEERQWTGWEDCSAGVLLPNLPALYHPHPPRSYLFSNSERLETRAVGRKLDRQGGVTWHPPFLKWGRRGMPACLPAGTGRDSYACLLPRFSTCLRQEGFSPGAAVGEKNGAACPSQACLTGVDIPLPRRQAFRWRPSPKACLG